MWVCSALAAPQWHLCTADRALPHDAASPAVPLWMLASDDSVQQRLLLGSIEEDCKSYPAYAGRWVQAFVSLILEYLPIESIVKDIDEDTFQPLFGLHSLHS